MKKSDIPKKGFYTIKTQMGTGFRYIYSSGTTTGNKWISDSDMQPTQWYGLMWWVMEPAELKNAVYSATNPTSIKL